MKTRLRMLIALPVLVALTVLLWLTVFTGDAARVTVTNSGTVEATEADLGFQAAGRIESIIVREGDAVAAGQVLAWLDRSELQAGKQAAEAQAAATRARLNELERGFRSEDVAQGRAAVRAATQRRADAERDRERARLLFEGGAISRQRLDDAETTFTLEDAQYDAARQQLQLLESGPRSEQIAAQQALLAQAEALVAQVDAMLDNAVVRAPTAGLVTVRHREPGEAVQPGAPVLTITNPNDRWVRIYVREDLVGRLALGQRATITADAYPDRTYEGEVVFIASEAEFTPRNVQTTAQRVKLVYRVKVRITSDPSHDLKPGLPADVRIEDRDR